MFDFGDNVSAEIQDKEGRFIVLINYKGERIEVSGFPSKRDANNFIFFADFENLSNTNDFILITNPKYELNWHHLGNQEHLN